MFVEKYAVLDRIYNEIRHFQAESMLMLSVLQQLMFCLAINFVFRTSEQQTTILQQTTKLSLSSANFKKNVKSELYHIENSKL